MVRVESLKNISTLVLDVDGVLTDGCIELRADGEWVRRFNVRDGVGIKELISKGYRVCVITGARSSDVVARVSFLGIPHFYSGIVDKEIVFRKFLEDCNLEAKECAYIGDDIFDIPVLEMAGFSATVPNAIDEALGLVGYVTKREGGKGAVREICDLILKYGVHSNSGV